MLEVLRRSDFPLQMKERPDIEMNNNNLMCDCRLSWLVGPNSALEIMDNPVCSSPSWLKGKPLLSLTQQDMA
ncbi:hypothetical protein MTO96_030796 [Rhipicephalus appendiculatus]